MPFTLRTASLALLLSTFVYGLGLGPTGAAVNRIGGDQRADGLTPELVVQTGHTSSLTSLAVSANGGLAVTGSEDGSAILWEVASGKQLRRFAGGGPKVVAVAISRDGRLLASAAGNVVTAWDAATGRVRQRFQSPGGEVTAVAISADSKLITAGLSASSVFTNQLVYGVVWDAVTGQEVSRYQGFHGSAYAIAFSPDGRTILSGMLDNTAVLWDALTGAEGHLLKGHADFVRTVAFSPDGSLAATGSYDRTARVWSVVTGKMVRALTEHEGGVRVVAFSPAGELLLTVAHEPRANVVRLWQTDTGKVVRRQEFNGPIMHAAAFALDEQRVLLTRYDEAVLWEPDAGKVNWAWLVGRQGTVQRVGFSPDGRFVEIEQWGAVYLWDTTRSLKPLVFENSSADKLVFAADGESFLEGHVHDGRVWNTSTRSVTRMLPGKQITLSGLVEFNPNPVTLSANGLLAATGGFKNVIVLWDVAGGRELRRFNGHTGDVHGVSFSPDGKLLLTASLDQTARVWDVATGNMLRQFPLTGGYLAPARFAPDGKHALVGDTGEDVTLWDLSTGQPVQRFTRAYDINPAGEMAFSPDGRYLLAGKDGASYTDESRLWDVKDRRDVRTLKGRSPVAFSPDSRSAVTGDDVSTLRLWDVETGSELRRFVGHTGMVWSAAFSPDGRHLISGGFDGTTRIWLTETGAEVCRLVAFKGGGWAVVAPDGRFDTNSLEQVAALHWVTPDAPFTPLPLEIFMRDYYEPGLLSRLLSGAKLRPVRDFAALNRTQPKVSITGVEWRPELPDTAVVTVQVASAASATQRDAGGRPLSSGVYDVRVFRGGQLVGYSPAADGPVPLNAGGTATLTYRVRLPRRGPRQIEFTAYAFNAARVKSDTARRSFEIPPAVKGAAGRVYLISVGVNSNDQPQWELHFAANDARRIQSVLRQKLEQLVAGGVYSEIIAVPLISDADVRDATRQNFRAVIDLLAGRPVDEASLRHIPDAARLRPASPDDVVILSFSGHGYADEDGAFYLVPSDTGAGRRAGLGEVLDRCVSSEDLSEWLRDVDAGELTLIVDACHSAAAVEGGGFKPGPLGGRGMGQLSYDKGMRVLAASQAASVALEVGTGADGRRIEQGLLSYALVRQGLEEGGADYLPEPDGRITLAEWLNYSIEQVPRLYDEARRGQRGVFENGKAVDGRRGAELFGEGPAAVSLQQPLLFDFVRSPRETLLTYTRP